MKAFSEEQRTKSLPLTLMVKGTSGRARAAQSLHVSPDLPGQPFLLGSGRSPFVIYQFGLNPNYCASKFLNFLKRKKKEKSSFFTQAKTSAPGSAAGPGNTRKLFESGAWPARPRLFREVTDPFPPMGPTRLSLAGPTGPADACVDPLQGVAQLSFPFS